MIGAITTAIQNPVVPVAVTVTGGTLYTSGSYNYRLFTANGTLGVSGGTLTYDCLVVAGGGGGGGGNINFGGGGGGGAGGLLYFSSQTTSGNLAVTIGGGGAGGTTSGTQGSLGNDGQLGALTLTKGGGGGDSFKLVTHFHHVNAHLERQCLSDRTGGIGSLAME